ncbi:MAG: methylated-DNA-protein-cysteine methyltransferase-like protein [Polaribacter sp.]|jgi:methylated-DNA-protein-cysteine methyltransferase-like protein
MKQTEMKEPSEKIKRIWKSVVAVPKGKVASYGQIADLAGLPGRARLVGKALGLAAKDQQLPWYRILRSNGQLAFEKGSKNALRQKSLLQEEEVVVLNNRVKLGQFGWQPDLAEILMKLEY